MPGVAVGGAGGVGDGGGASSTGCDAPPADGRDVPAPDGAVEAPGRVGAMESDGGVPVYDPGIIEKSGP